MAKKTKNKQKLSPEEKLAKKAKDIEKEHKNDKDTGVELKFMGRPPKFKKPEDMQKQILEYFKSCWDYKRNMFGGRVYDSKTKKVVMVQIKPYTITGIAVALGTSRQTLLNYEDIKNEYGKEFFDTIKRAKEICHQYAEDSLFIGKNPTGAMFNLKNNYSGWEDKSKHEHSGGISLTDLFNETKDDYQ